MKYENVKMVGDNDKARYVLRKDGERPLIVVGLNPSTANEAKADATMARVMGIAERNGFDSFIMLNLYRRTRQTLWSAVQMLTQKLCCQTIHDCPKVVPLHYESE